MRQRRTLKRLESTGVVQAARSTSNDPDSTFSWALFVKILAPLNRKACFLQGADFLTLGKTWRLNKPMIDASGTSCWVTYRRSDGASETAARVNTIEAADWSLDYEPSRRNTAVGQITYQSSGNHYRKVR